MYERTIKTCEGNAKLCLPVIVVKQIMLLLLVGLILFSHIFLTKEIVFFHVETILNTNILCNVCNVM